MDEEVPIIECIQLSSDDEVSNQSFEESLDCSCVICPNPGCPKRVPLHMLGPHVYRDGCTRPAIWNQQNLGKFSKVQDMSVIESHTKYTPDLIVYGGKLFFLKIERIEADGIWIIYIQMAAEEFETFDYRAEVTLFSLKSGPEGKPSVKSALSVVPIRTETKEEVADQGYCCVLPSAMATRMNVSQILGIQVFIIRSR